MGVVDDSHGHPMKLEEGAVSPLAGGILGYGYQCGMLWGAALAAGAEAHRLYGTGPQAEAQAVTAAQKLVKAFEARNKYINCSDITSMSWKGSTGKQMASQVLKFFLKGGPIVCFSMTASYAKIAFKEIDLTLSESPSEAPEPPVSCAAQLARKMGASELHAVMAAGFAGGIGLSGSACGALGAAIWLLGMGEIEKGAGKPGLDNTMLTGVIEKYLESSDYEFECAKIAGRKFEDVYDHASYLRQGGCAQLIEGLAAG